MLEKEVKIILTENEYHKVKQIFEWDKDYDQENYYYRTTQDMYENDEITIRVRRKGGNYYLQVKTPVSKEGSLHIRKEFEKKLDEKKDIISAKELTELTGMEFKEAQCVGSLVTNRKECHSYANTEICLDENRYFGKTDYELEIEYTGDYPQEVVEKIRDLGINTELEVTGKYNRFMMAYIDSMNS